MTTTGTSGTDLLQHARDIATRAATLQHATDSAAIDAALSGERGVALVAGDVDEAMAQAIRVAADERQWQVYVATGDVDRARGVIEHLRRSVIVESNVGALLRTLPVKPDRKSTRLNSSHYS